MMLFFCLFLLCCISCRSTPDITAQNNTAQRRGTLLPTPPNITQARHHTDEDIQAAIEQATPASIQAAVYKLYHSKQGFTVEKHRYLALAAHLMRFLYPLEPVNWNVPKFELPDKRLDALIKIENGMYPQTTGSSDFLEALIPAFILLKGISITPYKKSIEEQLHIARTINPDAAIGSYITGVWYEKQHILPDAEHFYRLAWEKDSSCYPAGIQYTKLLLQKKNGNKALIIAQILHNKYPQALSIQLLLAESYINTKQLEQAEHIVNAILKNDSAQKDALLLRIRIYIEQKEYLSAAALLDNYAKKNKTDKTFLLLKIRLLREWVKNITEAKYFLEQAEKLHPQAHDVLLACVDMCFAANETINGKNAEYFISALLQQDSRNSEALRLLVRQNIIKEQWEQAFSKAYELYSSDPVEEHEILYIRAGIGSKKWETAIAAAEQAYNKAEKPSETIISLYLDALYGGGQIKKIRSLIASSIPEARSSLKSLLIYYQALLENDDEKKLSLLRNSLLSNPRSEQTLHALYEWYFAHKDNRKALYYLKQVAALNPHNKTYQQETENLTRLLAK